MSRDAEAAPETQLAPGGGAAPGTAPGAPNVRVASAGTGKTTSLVRRYLELIDRGEALRRVAGVTFTRAAAAELRQRVGEAIEAVLRDGGYLGGLFTPSPDAAPRFERARAELEGALLTTIHGFMNAGLRLNAPQLGLDPGFTSLAEWEAEALFAVEVRSLLLLAQEPEHPLHEAARYLGHEALPKLTALFRKRSLAAELRFGAGPEERALGALYGAALAGFDRRLGASSLAPGEVERRALRMLRVPAARERLARRFPRVLVDEYQDVNPLQGRFFEELGAAGVALELVGDPKQSIYGFRNADVEVFRRALSLARRGGAVLPPLVESRRHSRAVLAFLNRLTERLGAQGKGFEPHEAPSVGAAGAQAEVAGAVEVHVVSAELPLAELRPREAEVLAERLRAHHAAGVSYDDMAVLARGHAGLVMAQRALQAAGVPCVLGQGRGYYQRPEVRDVHHALAVGVDPAGPSLAPFLRGPFAALELQEVAEVLAREAPERPAFVAERFPAVGERLAWLAELVRLRPLPALKRLLREPVVEGRSYLERLGRRERENVDALLFEVAAHPPADIALLLDRLEQLARQADAGDVPQSGAGVRLLTVHASKGLEFPLAAVIDAGAWPGGRVDPVLVEQGSGAVRVMGGEGYAEAAQAARERARHEGYRLLYVAASRARDVLLVTGSQGSAGPRGWLAEVLALGLGGRDPLPGVTLAFHDHRPAAPAPEGAARAVAAEAPPAPWVDLRLPRPGLPPLTSPTRLAAASAAPAAGAEPGAPRPAAALALEAEAFADELQDEPPDEPLPAAVLAASESEIERGRVGWGRARGTLVHYAIGQDWDPDDPATRATLAAQEVLFPFDEAQRRELLEEVTGLLRDYRALLGAELPALAARDVDRAELPLAVRRGELVWEGIVDRLYRVGDEWFLDDYKTDLRVVPERYHVQLGLYLEALEDALGVRPRGRLVYLRSRSVVEPERAALERALAEALGSPVGAATR